MFNGDGTDIGIFSKSTHNQLEFQHKRKVPNRRVDRR